MFSFIDIIIFVLTFGGMCWFVWVHIASDLPDDFIVVVRDKLKGK